MVRLSKILAIVGLVATVAGFIANDVLIDFTSYFQIIQVFALICLVFYIVINFNIIKKASKQRSAKYGASAALGVASFAAILVIINIIASYYPLRIDMTRGNQYSLSDQTVKLLKSLDKDITVTAFFVKDSQAKATITTVFNDFRDITKKIQVDFIDPLLQPSIANQYKVKEINTLIFERGDKEYRVTVKQGSFFEQLFTNAILKVSQERKKNIYFTSAHNEAFIDDSTPGGYSFAREHLEGLNYNIRTVSLITTGKVPEDCDVLVIANPKKPFLDEELKLLDDYVVRNGRFVFLVDLDADFSIISYLDKYGIHCNPDIIMDKGSQIFGGDFARPIIINYHEEEPITKGFNLSTTFPVARSIVFTKAFEPWRKYVDLALTNPGFGENPNVWAETNLTDLKKPKFDKGEDVPGPVAVAGLFVYDDALRQGKKQNTVVKSEDVTEMVIFGDSDFASNAHFNFFGNADLFTNTINYLAREIDLISITRAKTASSVILLSEPQRDFLYYFSIYFLPVIIFTMGIVIWLRRKNL